MAQPQRRKRISLSGRGSSLSGLGNNDGDIDNILASISRAQQERKRLQGEFALYNTWRYCILEAGAETFELSLVYAHQFSRCFERMRVGIFHLCQYIFTKFKVIQASRVIVNSSKEPLEDPRILELKQELLRLREEMAQMNTVSKSTSIPPSVRLETSFQSVGESSSQKHPPMRPLPFTADMLVSAKKQQKTPIKVNDRSAPKSNNEKDDSEDIQKVLQRALEQKFKRVHQAEKDDLDSSFDTGTSFVIETKRRKAGSENLPSKVKRPPLPPRPKGPAVSTSSSNIRSIRTVLGENNTD